MSEQKTVLVLTGYHGHASATGESGHASATGYHGHASAMGDYGHASAMGESGVAFGRKAKAGTNGAIAVEWYDCNRPRIAVGYCGENGVKSDTWYHVVDGKLAEVI